MNTFESLFYWSSTVLLAASFFLYLWGFMFGKSGLLRAAHSLILSAFAALTVFGIARWVRTGHPPFVTLFESMVISVWFLLLIALIMRARVPRFSVLLLPVAGVSFLLMGWSSSLPAEASPLTATLTNVWLFIHASFATAGASAFLIAASLSVLYLLGREKLVSMERVAAAVPEHSSLPGTIFNFLLFGLILWGVMIVSGSIWAHSAWGRYWAWDPIELWSLISWLLFVVLIHARITFKLNQRVLAICTIVSALTVVFALWGVHYIYETIHTYG